MTELWAKLGYVSFAADIFGYGQGILPKNVEEMSAQTAIYSKDRALMRARTQAGYDALLKNPMVDASKVALIGYCFGGDVGVEFGSTGAPLAANVSIHGSFGDYPAGWAKNAKGMFLILHGAEDQGYPLTVVDKVVQDLRGAKVAVPARGLQRHRSRLLLARRARTRSAPTRSRSPRPGGRSRSCSAPERGGQVRKGDPVWPSRSSRAASRAAMGKWPPARGFGAGPALLPIRHFFGPPRRAAIARGVMAVTAFLAAWFNLHPTRMEGSMRFETKQLIERLTLALGVAAVGIALLATVARSSGDPILARHDPAVIAAAHN